jgi:pilus assembly protein CpaE
VLGSVVTVLAPRGGSGKTVLACNLAVVLGLAGADVCLVDLDFAAGDIAGSLGLEVPASVMSAASADGHLVDMLLPSLIQPYKFGVDCVLAPMTPGDSEKVTAEFVEELLALLRSRYDFVIVDTPTRMSSRVQAALDMSDHHVLLSTPTRPALRSTRQTLDVLDLLCIPQAKRSVVLNHADTPGGLSDYTVGAIMRDAVAGRLPDSPEVMVSINNRIPLAISDPKHPYVTAVSKFAAAHLSAIHADTALVAQRRAEAHKARRLRVPPGVAS